MKHPHSSLSCLPALPTQYILDHLLCLFSIPSFLFVEKGTFFPILLCLTHTSQVFGLGHCVSLWEHSGDWDTAPALCELQISDETCAKK